MMIPHSDGDDHSDAPQSPLDEALSTDTFLRAFELGLGPVDQQRVEAAIHEVLDAVGEDPTRDGLLRTPKRVAKMYEELLSGYRTDPARLINNALFDVDY